MTNSETVFYSSCHISSSFNDITGAVRVYSIRVLFITESDELADKFRKILHVQREIFHV